MAYDKTTALVQALYIGNDWLCKLDHATQIDQDTLASISRSLADRFSRCAFEKHESRTSYLIQNGIVRDMRDAVQGKPGIQIIGQTGRVINILAGIIGAPEPKDRVNYIP